MITPEYISDNIILLHNFWNSSECLAFIKASEKQGFEPAKINTDFGAKVVTDVRNNYRLMYKDDELSQMLWQRLQTYAPQKVGNSVVVGLNELFRIYKYHPKQTFKKHRDESYIRNDKEASYYTFMIYLNDDFEGGETTFGNIKIKPLQGSALIFLHQLEHEGAEVVRGTKYVLRSDIMYRLSE